MAVLSGRTVAVVICHSDLWFYIGVGYDAFVYVFKYTDVSTIDVAVMIPTTYHILFIHVIRQL